MKQHLKELNLEENEETVRKNLQWNLARKYHLNLRLPVEDPEQFSGNTIQKPVICSRYM